MFFFSDLTDLEVLPFRSEVTSSEVLERRLVVWIPGPNALLIYTVTWDKSGNIFILMLFTSERES